jgi:hypothetical protein
VDDLHALNPIGAVLGRAVVPPPDLVLPVEPLLVVVGGGGVENPQPKAQSYGREVLRARLAVALAAEVVNSRWG